MVSPLNNLLKAIGQDYRDLIAPDARHYLEICLGRQAERMGVKGLKPQFQDVQVIVPLKHPLSGMKVRIDSRTFKNYVQFDSGIAVPSYVARVSGLPARTYTPQDSMVLNFA
jgi:hypothetical protein